MLSVYIPVEIQFGRINYGVIISAIQTSPGEAKEFLGEMLDTPLILMFLCWLALYCYSDMKTFSLGKRRKIICLVLLIGISVNAYPKRMVRDTVRYLFQARKDLSILREAAFKSDTFTTVKGKPGYKNIIVIIGESVAANYLSLYGYPHNNTPWLKNAPGVFFDNYISTAPNTFLSLPRTLAMSDGVNINVSNNVVALANRAGYDTYWISNQGFVGEYDTPVTVIAMRAKHRIFLKKGDYDSRQIDDFSVLPLIPDHIKEKTE